MGSGGGNNVSEVPTIFHPRRSRVPSIVLNEDQQDQRQASPGQVILDTGSSSVNPGSGGDHQTQNPGSGGGCGDSLSSCSGSVGGNVGISCHASGSGGGGGAGDSGGNQSQGLTSCIAGSAGGNNNNCVSQENFPREKSLTSCHTSCCAESAKKIYYGVCVTICVTATWVGATHCIKYLYLNKVETSTTYSPNSSVSEVWHHKHVVSYNAPFFTTWFCTNWAVLYFPVYFLCRAISSKCINTSEIIAESLRGFRDKGFTGGRFLTRCSLFCGLWVATNYMYIHSLRILLATDVMALFATNVSCVYLLSWVILHEQFVGIRIVAVILCDTGIALLAYMDGITGSPTLGGVVLAASAAAGSAVYKVLFKKVIGETTFGQISLFFSLIGLCNAALLWPVCLALYFSGAESVHWARLPWAALLSASILHLVANMLGNFSIVITYDLFITLGLITAVPVSAALDVVLYGAHFMGMKLAGMILIAVGFFLVMFPDNWPDYITRLLRTSGPLQRSVGGKGSNHHHHHHHRSFGAHGYGHSNSHSNPMTMIPHRQFKRNYGVSSSQGDGQTLLPAYSANNNNNNNNNPHHNHRHHNHHHHQTELPKRHSANNSSSSELPTPRKCVPTSTIISSHLGQTQQQQDGAGDTDTGCQGDPRAT